MLILLWSACEPMEPSGAVFTPVAPPVVVVEAVMPPAMPEDNLDFPTEPPLKLSSEELAEGTVSVVAAAGVDVAALAPEVPGPAPIEGLPAPSQFPVRVVSTLPQAQPPRAILGLPNGQEVVVSPGSILAEQGLVVLAVTGERVQLAKIEAAGDHAVITPLELSAQYPGPGLGR